jgi:hypothetical protein
MKICAYCDNYIAENADDRRILLMNQNSIDENLETGICKDCEKYEVEEKFYEENE